MEGVRVDAGVNVGGWGKAGRQPFHAPACRAVSPCPPPPLIHALTETHAHPRNFSFHDVTYTTLFFLLPPPPLIPCLACIFSVNLLRSRRAPTRMRIHSTPLSLSLSPPFPPLLRCELPLAVSANCYLLHASLQQGEGRGGVVVFRPTTLPFFSLVCGEEREDVV